MQSFFPAPSTAQLLRQLSDLESGNVRQWYWLELASAYPLQVAGDWRSRVWLAFLRWPGVIALLPWLARQKVPGLAIYQLAHQHWRSQWQQAVADALLGCGCVIALGLGFAWQAASMQFALWLIACALILLHGLRLLRRRAPQAQTIQNDELAPESSLGLTGLLLAAGCPASTAPTLVQLLRQQPERALPLLLAALPQLPLAPEHSAARQWRRSALCWLLLAWLASKLCASVASFALAGPLLALGLLALLAFFSQPRRACGLLLASWLGCALLAALLRWL